MQNQAFPEGPLPAFRLRIDEKLFDSAQRLYQKQSFDESLTTVQEALGQPAEDQAAGSAPSIRDGAILAALNLHQLRRYDDCRNWLRSAVADGLLPPDDPEAHLIELWIRWSEGQYQDVIDRTGSYIERYSGRLHPLLAEFLFLRGTTHRALGQHPEALADCRSAYAFFKAQQKRQEQAEACNALGIILFQQSRYQGSLRWLHESLEINRELGLPRRIGDNYLNIGLAYYKKGDYGEARRYLERAVEAHDDIDSPNLLCRARIALGNVSRLQRDFADARSNLMAAYTLATDRRLPREECLALEFLGDVLRDEGKPREARRYYARGMAVAGKIAPEGDLIMELLRRDGECLELLDQAEAAVRVLQKARKLATRLGDRFEEGVILRCLALAAARKRDWREAGRLVEDSVAFLESIKARHELGITHLVGARLFEARAGSGKKKVPAGLLEQSLKHALAAQQVFQDLDIPFWNQEADRVVSSLAWRHLGEVGAQDRRAGIISPAEAEAGAKVIAVSAAMRSALLQSESYAGFDEPVLVTGETGTGKELIARRIHQFSTRRDGPFVAVNCPAVPGTLFEREFFGHHKGAYTGAEDDQPGYVAQADGGTLFLDEIGELPLDLQPKLLRLLQEGTFNRLGDPAERSANVRLVAATNANLDRLVEEGKFRQDLNYRLKVLEVGLRPLRERTEDIVPLLQHFLSEFSGQQVTVWHFFNNESIQALRRYPWPGNVREVILVARRAHISLETEGRTEVRVGAGPEAIHLTGPARSDSGSGTGRARLQRVLEETGGNKAEAARQLGISRQTLYRWLKRHGISA